LRKWRPEYGHLFHVTPRDLDDMYPQQLAQMDETINEMRRKQRG
jgi:hypothetical protein